MTHVRHASDTLTKALPLVEPVPITTIRSLFFYKFPIFNLTYQAEHGTLPGFSHARIEYRLSNHSRRIRYLPVRGSQN